MDVDSPEFLENPYRFYDQRRRTGAIFKRDEFSWALTGYDILSKVLAHPAAGRGNIGQTPRPFGDQRELDSIRDANPALKILEEWMLFQNPPEHTNARARVADVFMIKMIERIEELMRSTLRDLISQIKEDSSDKTFDLIPALAYPFPAIVICNMIGIPPEDRLQFEKWTSDFSVAVEIDFHKISDQQRSTLNQTAFEIMEYFEKLIATKKAKPGDDLISRFIAEHASELSHHELLSNCVFLLFAGQETTTSLISNAVHALLSHPEQLKQLRADPGLIKNAVEECLRYDPSIQMVGRFVLYDFEIEGIHFSKGDHIFAFLGAAGRDPAANPKPHEFNIHRKNIKHLAFTRGVHHCLGASLARLEIRVLLEELLDGFENLSFVGGPERRSTWLMRGFQKLPISFVDLPSPAIETRKIVTLPSALYPFKTNELLRKEYQGYSFINVFENITEQQKQACVDLWMRNRAIENEATARSRADQVCYLIQDSSSNRVIGMNTLYTDILKSNGENYFFNRMFIQAEHRHSRLMITGTALMLCFAKIKLSDRGLSGIINVNENRKLSRPGMQKIFRRLGYNHLGWEGGNEVILFEFDQISYNDETFVNE